MCFFFFARNLEVLIDFFFFIRFIFRAGLAKKPIDYNAATHLIRNALGGTEYGVEHSKISHMLALPKDIVRLYRDDITVTVIFFDQEFLRNSPT